MTTEATATESTATTVDESAEDADLMAGFTAVAGEPEAAPAATATDDDPTPAQAAADAFADELDGAPEEKTEQQQAAEEATTAAAQAALGSMSDDEINTLRKRLGLESIDSLKQGLDNLAGRVGGINRVLQSIQSIGRDAPQGSATATAAAKFNRLVLKELSEFKNLESEYPDLAQHIAPVLDRVIEATANAAAKDAQPNDVVMGELRRLQEREFKREARAVERAVPNWQAEIAEKNAQGNPVKNDKGQYVPSQKFVEWFKAQPAEFRDEFWNGTDADVVIEGVTQFRQYASSAPTPAPAPAPAPAAATRSKQQRLAAAATPSGMPAPVNATTTPSEDDDMEAGFMAVRGRRALIPM